MNYWLMKSEPNVWSINQQNIDWQVRVTRYWGGIIDKNSNFKGKF